MTEALHNEEKIRLSHFAHVVATKKGYAFIERFPDTDNAQIPECGPDEIVVRPLVVAVCGSDGHANAQDSGTHPNARFLPNGLLPNGKSGFIPFHEGTGIVIAMGRKVTGLETGMRIAVESTIFPKNCPPGRWSQGEELEIVGLGTNGLGAELAVIPAKVAIPMPKEVPDELAAQFEPLGVSIHAWVRAIHVYEVTTGKNAQDAWFLINGATGSVGRLALASLIAKGVPVEHIIATGTNPQKLINLMKEYQGLHVVNLTDTNQMQAMLNQASPQLGEFDGHIPIVIEATGHNPAPIMPFVGKGTVFVAVGLPSVILKGECLADTNNFLVRRQRTLLTPGDKSDEGLMATAKEIYKRTVTAEKEPKIRTFDESINTTNLPAHSLDIVLDRVGLAPAEIDRLLKKGGILITVPLRGNSSLPIAELLELGVVVVGSWGRDKEDWQTMVALIQEGKLTADQFPITLYKFKPDGFAQALKSAGASKVGFDMREKAVDGA